MKRLLLLTVLIGSVTSLSCGADLERPVRLQAGDTAIRVESPGYAAPCWADLARDGKNQLLVGQFHKGQIHVFQHLGAEKFAPGTWLQADGKIAEIPGVW